MPVKTVTGDIWAFTSTVRVNTVNCVGVMGRGIALDFKDRYPRMFMAYAKACKAGELHPGGVFDWTSPADGVRILNIAHSIEEALLPSLVECGLASTSPTGPQITPLGRQVSSAVEARTNELTDATLATVTAATTERLLEGLLRLPGDDPRPTADR